LGGRGFRAVAQAEQGAPLAARVARRVDDDPPDPRFERAAAAIAAPFPHGLGESLLHGIFAERGVTCDRGGGPAELGSPRAVELFEVVDHHPSDAPDEVDSLRREPFRTDTHAGIAPAPTTLK
jgi:hypothetical protein